MFNLRTAQSLVPARSIQTAVLVLTIAASSRSELYEFRFDTAPASQYLDRWVYPFNITPGTRIQAPTFGAVGSTGVDERDGQYLIAVNTDQLGIPTDQPNEAYRIHSARFVLTEAVGGYAFDGTYDRFTTYLAAGSSAAEADDDVGRPIELYGAELRNGFETFGWPDGGTATDPPVYSAGSAFGASDRATRNVFPVDSAKRDVSNHIDSLNHGTDGFDPNPFAIGHALDDQDQTLDAGSVVQSGTRLAFKIDVTNQGVLAYLQDGLAAGQLGFIVSSLHNAGFQGEGDPYPNLATSDHFAFAGPQFQIEVDLADTAMPGDLDENGILDVRDVNLLSRGVDTGSSDPALDLNRDTVTDLDDVSYWLHELANTYFGDANLDGEFNSGDLVAVFSAGQYEDDVADNSSWETGDWNADREFDTSDLVTAFQDGGYEQGPRAAVAPVPEPVSVGWFSIVSAGWLIGRRWRIG